MTNLHLFFYLCNMYPSIASIVRHFDIADVHPGATTGTDWLSNDGNLLHSYSPIDKSILASVKLPSHHDLEFMHGKMRNAFLEWRSTPAPKRGELVRKIGLSVRANKTQLASLISYEMGKPYRESLGEVQEIIDICDFAVGQSRMLYGLTMPSERPQHRLMEQWHPLGIVGIITAFNFPVAVWSWNAMLSLICGNVILWKPSEKTPLCAIAIHKLIEQIILEMQLPEGICNLFIADGATMGHRIIEDKRIPLISFTGSTAVGRKVATMVSARFGKTILELGGNNAVIVTDSANIPLAIKAIVFGAIGTSGQRCTSTRRVLIQSSIYEVIKDNLINAYATMCTHIGQPLDENTWIGPLIDQSAVEAFLDAQQEVVTDGGSIIFGGESLQLNDLPGFFVKPCIAEVDSRTTIVQKETFAPLLFLMKFDTIEEAIAINNNVSHGLSSSIFTSQLQESELFISAHGSDCGIANVNIGTSGAEIGGAFGGEKDSGGGRESGSDAWKAYMRRQTNTINFGNDLPLAQDIQWDV